MASSMTAVKFRAQKGGSPLVVLTAYDAFSAQIADSAGVDAVLVGDSLGNVIQGKPTTLGVSLDEMLYHTEIVARHCKHALVIADMPFGSYQQGVEAACASAIELMKAGAGAVKLEGPYLDEIHAIVKAGIPVMGHAGFTPQSIHAFGGHKVQGKSDTDAADLLHQCSDIEEAGAFGLVLELIPKALSARITSTLKIPTIGIGAGSACDGQVQVFHDIMGMTTLDLKHAKKYVNGHELMLRAAAAFSSEVRNNQFPTDENSF